MLFSGTIVWCCAAFPRSASMLNILWSARGLGFSYYFTMISDLGLVLFSLRYSFGGMLEWEYLLFNLV